MLSGLKFGIFKFDNTFTSYINKKIKIALSMKFSEPITVETL